MGGKKMPFLKLSVLYIIYFSSETKFPLPSSKCCPDAGRQTSGGVQVSLWLEWLNKILWRSSLWCILKLQNNSKGFTLKVMLLQLCPTP